MIWDKIRSAVIPYSEKLSEKDNVLAPDLSTVDTKVHIISAQAVGKIHAHEVRSPPAAQVGVGAHYRYYFALLLTFNHKRT